MADSATDKAGGDADEDEDDAGDRDDRYGWYVDRLLDLLSFF